MLGVATDRGGGTATPAPLLWRQRFHARRPQAGRGLDADGIGKTDFGYAVAELGVVAVSRVGQCDFGVDPGGNGRTQLVKSDLRLGLEDDIVGYASCGTSGRIINPLMRQIEAISDRQAGVIARRGEAHRDLTIVLLTELPTVLPRHADRVLALFRDAGVVDDQ